MRRVRRTVLAAVALAAGCDRPAAEAPAAGPPVTGRVVVRGLPADRQSPLEGGRVRFESAADPAFAGVGVIDADGTFQAATVAGGVAASGLPPGEYRARIEPPPDGSGTTAGVVAAKYLSAKTSGLRVTVPPAAEVVLVVDRPAVR
jgi:hypothetical protein